MYNLKIAMEYVCCMDVNYANHWLSEICFRKVSASGVLRLADWQLIESGIITSPSQPVKQSKQNGLSLLVLPGSEDKAATIYQCW